MFGGLAWLAQLGEHSSYAGGILGPTMLVALGMGLTFVPLSLVALAKVANSDTGVASSLMNAGQQVGGSIGLALLGTVAWSAVSSNLHSAHLPAAATKAQQAAATNHALAYGFAHGYWVSAGVAALAVVISALLIRIKASDLSGVNPMAAPVD
jgi:hypothetical protein